MSAFGSAMFRSPSIAKLAVTPPVVGSVSSDTYGNPARSSRPSAAQILAICISDSAPSIIRAPPEHETTISAAFDASARSAARVIFSPTTTPMLPPMKPYSMDAITTGIASSVPLPTTIASLSPVDLMLASSRLRYGLVSVNVNGSSERRSGSWSVHAPSSNSIRSRSAAVMRK